jgi:type IV pilus assembly protein PilQ
MLSMQGRRNIVASKKVTGTVTANLYNVTFAEALTAILQSNGAGWREKDNFIYVYSSDELAAMDSANAPPPVTRLFRLHYVRSADVQTMITPLLSKDGKIAVPPPATIGLASSKDNAGGDSASQEDYVIITDHPERMEQIARLIADIDVRPKQILVEATILRALLNEDNALGIDFNVVGGVDFTNLGGQSNADTNLTLGQLPTRRLENTTFAGNTDFRGQVPNGGFTFGLIKNNIAMFIRALEQVTDTTVLANPKVLALNKQRGEVIVGRRDGYLTTTVTQTAAVQTVEFLETGTRLVFRPYIGDDGYVRMEVHPEDSTGGVTAANLPFEQTTEVTTNILVRDGHTILIGGLFRELTTSARGQVPVAGNIPLAGALFRNSRDTTQREEIIILLTVHVIKDDQAMHEASAEVIQDVERYRVGMRQGLQWFGRERLAQAHYRWALEHLEHGRVSKALWDLDLAINNNPKFLAAVKLKESLLCRREWDEDNTSIRGYLERQIQREQGRDLPPYGRPAPQLILPELKGPNGFDESPSDRPKAEKPSASANPANEPAEKGGSP